MHQYNYYRLIPKDVLISKEFNECYQVIDKSENSYLSAMFSAFSGKLTSFSDDIRFAVITVWNRKNFPLIYQSVKLTANELFDDLERPAHFTDQDWATTKLSVVVGVCIFTFTFVKSGHAFSSKLKIKIGDICRDILCDYCDKPEDAFDVVRETIENCRGVLAEAATMQVIFKGLTRIAPEIKDCVPSGDGVLFCRKIGNLLRKTFEQHY